MMDRGSYERLLFSCGYNAMELSQYLIISQDNPIIEINRTVTHAVQGVSLHVMLGKHWFLFIQLPFTVQHNPWSRLDTQDGSSRLTYPPMLRVPNIIENTQGPKQWACFAQMPRWCKGNAILGITKKAHQSMKVKPSPVESQIKYHSPTAVGKLVQVQIGL